MKIKDSNFGAVIDSGSTYNYILDKIVEKLQLETFPLDQKLKSEIQDRSLIELTRQGKISIKIESDRVILYDFNYKVLHNRKESIIIGFEFLRNNDELINLRHKSLTLDGTEYDLENSEKLNRFSTRSAAL